METVEGRLPPLLKASGCADMFVGKFTSKYLYHRVLGHTHTHTHTHTGEVPETNYKQEKKYTSLS